MSQIYTTATLLTGLSLLSTAGLTATYKWVDNQGGIHYTQVPPYNHKADIIKPGTGGAPDSKQEKPAAKQPAEATAKKEPPGEYNTLVQDKADIEARKKAEALQQKQTKEACEALRNNLKILKENAHIRIRSNENDQPRVLTPKERSQRIKQYSDSLKSMCK